MDSNPHLFDADNLRLPPAAALVVRKQVWCENVPEQSVLSGKLTNIFVAGDDYEPSLLHYAGWEIWYNPTMHILSSNSTLAAGKRLLTDLHVVVACVFSSYV